MTPARDSEQPVERFAATSGQVLGWVGVTACAAVVGLASWSLVEEPEGPGLSIALGAVFGAVLVWATQLRPRATAYAGHVELRNTLRDAHVPLAKVEEVFVGQTLIVWAEGRRYVCIGIGRSRRADMRARRRDPFVGTGRYTELQARSERANLDQSGSDYQTFVETRLTDLVERAKREQPPAPEGPRHVVSVPVAVAMAVTGLAFVVSLLV